MLAHLILGVISIQPLLDYEPQHKGFHANDFREAMEWGRGISANEFYVDRDVLAVEENYKIFCTHLNSDKSQVYIPQIIHLIWLGSAPSEKVEACFDSWTKHHPGWDVRIWTDKEMQNFTWTTPHSKQCFSEADTWAEKADVLRLEILYQFGGIYSDADVVCLNSFDDLTRQDIGFFGCFELNYVGKHYGEPFFIGSAVMGARKNSTVIEYCIQNLRSKADAPEEGIIKRTGPGLVSRACQAKMQEEFVLILPCSYFYPLPWKQREVENPLSYVSPDSLAIHLWDGSWCTHKKKNGS